MTKRTLKREARERLRTMLKDAGGAVASPPPLRGRSASEARREGGRVRPAVEGAPLPSPPPQGGREQAERGSEDSFLPPAPTKLQQTDPSLTDIVRALYEEGVVPVVEIARLAGVAQRTLYRYVARQGWKRRDPARGPAVAAANRGRPWVRPEGFAQRRGAGGRFLAPGEVDDGARGLKSLDPAGAGIAAERGQRLAELSAATLARTQEQHFMQENARTLLAIVQFARAVFEERTKQRR